MPPDPVVIFDESGSARTSFVGPYTEGQQVTLICDAFGGETVSDAVITFKCPMRCDEMLCEFSWTAFVVSFLILKQF